MNENEPKRLYRSRADRIFAGVLGGIAMYFNIDTTLVRVIFVLLLVLTGFVPFGLIYILMWLIVPESKNTTENINDEDKSRLEKSRNRLLSIIVIIALLFLMTAFFATTFSIPWML